MTNYTLVEKELVNRDGKAYYKLMLYDHPNGVVFQVFAPIIEREIVNTNALLENAK